MQIEQIGKKKYSRQELVVRLHAAGKAARVPLPHRLRRKPEAYADGFASKSDKASLTHAPRVRGFFRGCIVRLLLLRLLLLRLLACLAVSFLSSAAALAGAPSGGSREPADRAPDSYLVL